MLRESLEYHDLIESHIIILFLVGLLNLEGVVLSVLLRFRLVDCTEGSSSDYEFGLLDSIELSEI